MSPVFELVRDLYVINTWLKFEDKILKTLKVIVFTRNHTDDDTDDRTKNNMSPPPPRSGEDTTEVVFGNGMTKLVNFFAVMDRTKFVINSSRSKPFIPKQTEYQQQQ